MLLNINHPVINGQQWWKSEKGHFKEDVNVFALSRSLPHQRRGRRTCRTLAPTLFLKANDLCVRAKAVPRRAVVNGLEVSWDNVAHGQGGDDSFLGGHRLHGVTARCSWLQHRLLPWPSLRKGKHFRKGCFLPPASNVPLWKERTGHNWPKKIYVFIQFFFFFFVR